MGGGRRERGRKRAVLLGEGKRVYCLDFSKTLLLPVAALAAGLALPSAVTPNGGKMAQPGCRVKLDLLPVAFNVLLFRSTLCLTGCSFVLAIALSQDYVVVLGSHT